METVFSYTITNCVYDFIYDYTKFDIFLTLSNFYAEFLFCLPSVGFYQL
jgi:hypothetical protein